MGKCQTNNPRSTTRPHRSLTSSHRCQTRPVKSPTRSHKSRFNNLKCRTKLPKSTTKPHKCLTRSHKPPPTQPTVLTKQSSCPNLGKRDYYCMKHRHTRTLVKLQIHSLSS